MRHLFPFFLAFGLCMIWASGARAEGVPWKQGEPAKENSEENKEGTESKESAEPSEPAKDLETALGPQQYQHIIGPILKKIEQAEEDQKAYDEEMAKPEEKRNLKQATTLRVRIARSYLNASLQARRAKKLVEETDIKDAITAQYEKPCQDKAIEIYLALAEEAKTKGDLRTAVAYYQKVLQIDPENATAKEELKNIEKTLQEEAEAKRQTKKKNNDDETKHW